jgi:ADP-heptose:LPS heptosyltransferase
VKILVLKRDKLGDLLLTSPLFAKLRLAYPEARIELLASEYNAWVAQGNPNLDFIHAYPRVRIGRRVAVGAALRQLVQFSRLRRNHYDLVIVAQGEDSARAIERALWLSARRVIAYASKPARYGKKLTDALAPPDGGHEAERLLGLLQPLGIDTRLDDAAPFFELPPSAKSQARSWLGTQGIEPSRYIVLGLGARRARKQPTTEQIVRWIEHVQATYGLATVFMWTPGASNSPLYPGDDAIAEPVLKASPKGLVPFRGPLQPALGLIWDARTSIFPDSGLMHFASASQGRVLGLFGDTPEFAAKWAPLGSDSMHLIAPRVSEMDDVHVFDALAALINKRA